MKKQGLLTRLSSRLKANSPGMVIAVVALLVALTGGALAASGKLTKQQVKEVKKIAKSYQGTGPKGATGPQGPQGPAGSPGSEGKQGSAGSPGKSVVVSEIPLGSEPECNGNGGAFVEEEGAASGIEVCNGEAGSPWAPENSLPPNATETGAWAMTGTTADSAGVRVPISFPVQLAAGHALTEEHVHIVEAPTEACPGTAAAPSAEPGELCVYVSNLGVIETEFLAIDKVTAEESGANRTGAMLVFKAPTGNASASGTFAVTASE